MKEISKSARPLTRSIASPRPGAATIVALRGMAALVSSCPGRFGLSVFAIR